MNRKPTDRKLSIGYVIVAVLMLVLIQRFIVAPLTAIAEELTYSEFLDAVRAGSVAEVGVGETRITGVTREGATFTVIRVEDGDLLDELERHEVAVRGDLESDGSLLTALVGWLLPLGLMFGAYYLMMKRARGGAGTGGSIFSFGKSKARVVHKEQSDVTFGDVGGAGEAVAELKEITDFLSEPQRFQRLGGKMPKGVLLVGPPGTGKTLLARATAGEAGVPFFSLSGAEFVEMFVGVGASRVRDLFDQAKQAAPSIVFIDEIDAIGSRRSGAGAVSSHEEREQTLNQLLAEMDGFEANQGVVVMSATNRPEVLDPALLRPGRFDRQVVVDLPDLAGREEILAIHARGVPLDDAVDLGVVARVTSGFSGADLANVVNEAALLAARRGLSAVTMAEIDEAIERVVAGSGRRARAMSEAERRRVAVHEAGHALAASLLPGNDPVHKVTIVPRGRALGYTWQRPAEERLLLDEGELAARLAVLLAGRAAEGLVLGQPSTGAADDLARATDLARRMVIEYGMSPELGPVRLATEPQAAYLGSSVGLDARVSPQTAARVDEETRRLVEAGLDRAWQLLDRHRGTLRHLAERLCAEETLDGDQLAEILGTGSPEAPAELTVGGNGHVAA